MSEASRHLSIGEVLSLVQAEFPDVTISKIRFLESQGLLDPERTPSGYRKFYDHDITQLRWILLQQRDHFLPLRVIKERLDAGDEPAADGSTGAAAANDRGPDAASRQPPADEAARERLDVTSLLEEPTDMSDHDDRRDATGSAGDPGTAAAADAAAAEAGPSGGPGPGAEPSASGEQGPSGEPDAADVSVPSATARESVPDRAGAIAAGRAGGPGRQDPGPPAGSVSRTELAATVKVRVQVVDELESYGIISSGRVGSAKYYGADAIATTRAAVELLGRGVEVRHLRMYKIAAEREAGFFAQLALPLLKQRDASAHQQADRLVTELAEAGRRLHAALLHVALSESLPQPEPDPPEPATPAQR